MSSMQSSLRFSANSCQAFRSTRPLRASTSRTILTVEANKKVQKKQKVILTRPYEGVGEVGDLISVPTGFWRNYLHPRGIAKLATEGILEEIKKKQEEEVREKLEIKAKAQAFATGLATIGKFIIKKRVGDKEQVFGSVQISEIQDAIYKQTGQSVADCEMEVPEMKTTGTYECRIRLHPEVVGTFSVVIQREKNAPPTKVTSTPADAPPRAGKKVLKKKKIVPSS